MNDDYDVDWTPDHEALDLEEQERDAESHARHCTYCGEVVLDVRDMTAVDQPMDDWNDVGPEPVSDDDEIMCEVCAGSMAG